MMTGLTREEEKRQSQVAMAGITLCLVLTSLGMAFSSPILGGIGLAAIVILVPFRGQIAKRLARR